jgi:hypothetical protein
VGTGVAAETDGPVLTPPSWSFDVATSPQSPDPLQPVLREAEAELSRRLHEACEAESRGVANESAAEIRQLEDALLAAAVAAEHTLSLRRHIEQTSAKGPNAKEPIAKAPSATEGATTGSVREFRDGRGRAWRAWPVTPGLSRAGRTKHFLGEFQVGWICFEGIDDAARRRLPGHPARWSDLGDQELDALLEQAISVRERKPQPTNASAPPPAR